MRLFCATLLGRTTSVLTRLIGRAGSALPGLVGEKIAPNLVEKILGGTPVVLITGTNGKTTTTKMIVSALESRGRSVVTNPTGSNLERGVASALLDASSLRGRLDADVAVFEVDEAAVRSLAPRLKPAVLAVTNLARDQLDRYGELQTTASHVAAAATHAGHLILNADDPLVASVANATPVSWFGGTAAIRDRMPDDRSLYGDTTEAEHQKADALVVDSQTDGDGQVATIRIDGIEHRIRLQVPGVYNAYNAASALLVTGLLGVPAADAIPALEAMEPAFGRGQVLEHLGRRVKLLLVKNPASLNHAIEILKGIGEHARVLVAINDEHADGRDVSWLWDSHIEDHAATPHQYLAGGVRAADMALRFKYAGIDAPALPEFADALDLLADGAPPGSTVYVVPTYTAMLRLLEILTPGASRTEVWK